MPAIWLFKAHIAERFEHWQCRLTEVASASSSRFAMTRAMPENFPISSCSISARPVALDILSPFLSAAERDAKVAAAGRWPIARWTGDTILASDFFVVVTATFRCWTYLLSSRTAHAIWPLEYDRHPSADWTLRNWWPSHTPICRECGAQRGHAGGVG